MTDLGPEQAVALAIEVAEDGLSAGELPIGAVVVRGARVLARAYTEERRLGRRVVHADLMALLEADGLLGFTRSPDPLVLAVSLEPCLMCPGAAITVGVTHVWFGLESPNDEAVALLDSWRPPVEQPFFRRPHEILGGIHRDRVKEQFARYAASDAPAGMRDWARGLSVS